MRLLTVVNENGKPVWRLSSEEVEVTCQPCKKLKKARQIALQMAAEIEAEKNKASAEAAVGETE